MRLLVVNADDFGLTDGVTAGILDAMRTGIVSSTSVMTCVPGALDRLRRHAPALRGRAGVHLQLTQGVARLPAGQIPSLVDEAGAFPDRRGARPLACAREIEREWRAQVECVLDAGIQPTHIDSHQHVHKDPSAFQAYCRIARKFSLPARSCSPAMSRRLRGAGVDCPHAFECSWSASGAAASGLLEAARRLFAGLDGDAVVEAMCHPGRDDDDLRRLSRLAASRERELAALTEAGLRETLCRLGMELTTMARVGRAAEKNKEVLHGYISAHTGSD
jgi:predicted glycoside hydrolase/deacetylase ChbG (UPF0249 family)